VIETAFLDAVATLLTIALGPTPPTIGFSEAESADDLPLVVLSLETNERRAPGLGERADTLSGALPWSATIDLASPFLDDDPSVPLLDASRRVLQLPHGGLVRADGHEGSLGPLDLTVRVGASQRTVVDHVPGAAEVQADGAAGTLTFGSALPASGNVVVDYRIGRWERRVERASGLLRVDCCGASANETTSLSASVVEALLGARRTGSLLGLLALSLASLSSVGRAEEGPNLRRRSARFRFEFQHNIDQPESSGGPIRRVRVVPPEPPLEAGVVVQEEFQVVAAQN
jgi:hypothetical protein